MFTSVAYIIDNIMDYESITDYDYNPKQCIVDNSADAHIWSILADFIPGTLKIFNPGPTTGVLTIGGSNQYPYSRGNIKVSCFDSNGTLVEYILKGALCFPDPPVNITSVTTFIDQLDDDEGTSIMTKCRHSVFT